MTRALSRLAIARRRRAYTRFRLATLSRKRERGKARPHFTSNGGFSPSGNGISNAFSVAETRL